MAKEIKKGLEKTYSIPAPRKVAVHIPPEFGSVYDEGIQIAGLLGLSINDLFRIGLSNLVKDHKAGILKLN